MYYRIVKTNTMSKWTNSNFNTFTAKHYLPPSQMQELFTAHCCDVLQKI